MAWTALTFPYGSILTSTKMTNLYDNMTAIATGLSGAPKIVTAAFSADTLGATALNKYSTQSSQFVTAGATWVPTDGFLMYYCNSHSTPHLQCQVNIGGTWRGTQGDTFQTSDYAGTILCDGTNVRFFNDYAGTLYVNYRKGT